MGCCCLRLRAAIEEFPAWGKPEFLHQCETISSLRHATFLGTLLFFDWSGSVVIRRSLDKRIPLARSFGLWPARGSSAFSPAFRWARRLMFEKAIAMEAFSQGFHCYPDLQKTYLMQAASVAFATLGHLAASGPEKAAT